MVVVMPSNLGSLRRVLGQVLLNVGVILLRGGKVSRLQVLRELVERLRDGVAARGRSGGAAALRQILLQGHKVGLRGAQVPGLKVFSELLELLLQLLETAGIGVTGGEKSRH
jgi:hypothetical protein